MRRASALLSAAAVVAGGGANNAVANASAAGGWLAGKLTAGVGQLKGFVASKKPEPIPLQTPVEVEQVTEPDPQVIGGFDVGEENTSVGEL